MAKTIFAVSFGIRGGDLHEHGKFQISTRKKAMEICNELTMVFGEQRPFKYRRNIPYQSWESSTHYVSMQDYSNVK